MGQVKLGNNVRVFRERRGESLRQLAPAVGMDYSHLSRLERGKANCSDQKKLAIARHFEVGLGHLFFVEDVA